MGTYPILQCYFIKTTRIGENWNVIIYTDMYQYTPNLSTTSAQQELQGSEPKGKSTFPPSANTEYAFLTSSSLTKSML